MTYNATRLDYSFQYACGKQGATKTKLCKKVNATLPMAKNEILAEQLQMMQYA